MIRRPLSVTVISLLFIAVGSIGLINQLTKLRFEYHRVWLGVVQLLAIVAGLFMLRGRNWARWLLLIWIVSHVILSAFHTPFELAIHSLLLLVVAYFLFRPKASAYLGAARTPSGGQNRNIGDV